MVQSDLDTSPTIPAISVHSIQMPRAVVQPVGVSMSEGRRFSSGWNRRRLGATANAEMEEDPEKGIGEYGADIDEVEDGGSGLRFLACHWHTFLRNFTRYLNSCLNMQ